MFCFYVCSSFFLFSILVFFSPKKGQKKNKSVHLCKINLETAKKKIVLSSSIHCFIFTNCNGTTVFKNSKLILSSTIYILRLNLDALLVLKIEIERLFFSSIPLDNTNFFECASSLAYSDLLKGLPAVGLKK